MPNKIVYVIAQHILSYFVTYTILLPFSTKKASLTLHYMRKCHFQYTLNTWYA